MAWIVGREAGRANMHRANDPTAHLVVTVNQLLLLFGPWAALHATGSRVAPAHEPLKVQKITHHE